MAAFEPLKNPQMTPIAQITVMQGLELMYCSVNLASHEQ